MGYSQWHNTCLLCNGKCDVETADDVGGLVGFSQGTISACYATGDVTGTGNNVGGLVG